MYAWNHFGLLMRDLVSVLKERMWLWMCLVPSPDRPTERYRLNNSRPISPLRRTLRLELLLRRRRLRLSAGSAGLSPLARACRFNISVRLTTPTKRPESRAPGRAEAGMDGATACDSPAGAACVSGGCTLALPGVGEGGECVFPELVGRGRCTAEWDGVGGPDEEGDNGSVIHRLFQSINKS